MKSKNFNLLIALTITSILFLIYGFVEKLHFVINLYLGLFSIILCYLIFYFFEKYFKYFFGIVLLLGFFGVLNFVPFQMGISIGFFAFQVIPLPFLIIFCYFNKSRILDLIQVLNFKTDEEKLNESQSRFEKFKTDFEKLSDKEIENRLNYDLTPEARKALLEIKKERLIK